MQNDGLNSKLSRWKRRPRKPVTQVKIVIFNGPPGCGKDTATNFVQNICFAEGFNVVHLKFATPIKKAVHAFHGLPPYTVQAIEEHKDIASPRFLGRVPRDAYIALSEGFAKPMYGIDVFGRLMVRSIKDAEALYTPGEKLIIVISDCGFSIELTPLFAAFGPENIALITLSRPGCSFANDSRKYVTVQDLEKVGADYNRIKIFSHVKNNDTKRTLEVRTLSTLKEFLNLPTPKIKLYGV